MLLLVADIHLHCICVGILLSVFLACVPKQMAMLQSKSQKFKLRSSKHNLYCLLYLSPRVCNMYKLFCLTVLKLRFVVSIQWFPLSKTTSGHLHLKLEWLSLVNDQEKLHEVSILPKGFRCFYPWPVINEEECKIRIPRQTHWSLFLSDKVLMYFFPVSPGEGCLFAPHAWVIQEPLKSGRSFYLNDQNFVWPTAKWPLVVPCFDPFSLPSSSRICAGPPASVYPYQLQTNSQHLGI